MTTDVIIPFPEDLVHNDLVENNLPASDDPSVSPTPSSPDDSDENDVNTSDSTWATTLGKEFRSSFLFQSSCYLPDDDGTESETSHSQRTPTKTLREYPLSLLHRDEQYSKRQQSSLLHESISGTSISSILKISTPNSDNSQQPRRVMFYDDGDDNLNNMNSNIHPSNPGEDEGEEKSPWAGINRISVPLHHKFHSLPQIPTVKFTTNSTTTLDDVYHSQQPQWQQQEQQDQLQQYGDEEDPGTVASEMQYNNIDVWTRKRRQRVCIFSILFLVLCSMSVALTCGTTQCGRDIREEHSSAATSPTNASSPTVKLNESLSPIMAPARQKQPSEQTTPTMLTQTVLTIPPTISPTVTHEIIVIDSTEQLYRAVDAYLLYRYNKTTVETDDNDYFNTPIGQWDVSRLRNFTSVFSALRNPMVQQYFNADIGMWDTSNAVTMEQMFYGSEKWVKGNISHWRTSNVTNMKEMFARASNFNDDLSFWDVSKVTTMEGMCK